jgi:NAD+ synthetase
MSFNPESYLQSKIEIIKNWLVLNNKHTVVLGVSGGIDSAVTLGILLKVQEKYPNILRTVVPVIAPIHNSRGTTEQHEATILGATVCKHFNIKPRIAKDLKNVSKALKYATSNTDSDYVTQQKDYWIRPTIFYGIAMEYEDSVLCSTMNYSEWVCGYFSKYLDVLDIRPIVDLYKSQVYLIAIYLGVPFEIINTPPKGGLANAKTDEQELGFTYLELEDYLNHTEYTDGKNTEAIRIRMENSQFKRDTFNPNFIHSLCIVN